MNWLKKCIKMRNVVVIGLLIIIGEFTWGQIPVDDLHYYSLEEVQQAHPDPIYAIDLSKKKLVQLPSELKQYRNLKGLKLTKNKLEELPEFFTLFSQLEFLYLDKNKFNHFPPQLFYLEDLRSEERRVGKDCRSQWSA